MIISETEKLLRTHATQYPLSEPCDAVKLLYQNEFGGDHLVDPSAGELMRRYLFAEYYATPQCSGIPLYEPIGNGIVRVNLAALDNGGVSPERLLDVFVRSASQVRGDTLRFEQKLGVLKTLTSEGIFGFSADVLDGYLEEYRNNGFPAVSHSPAYRNAYSPHYRVVLFRLLFPDAALPEI